jgi:hypothetical protein
MFKPSPEALERDHQLLLPPRLDWLKRLREIGVSVDALAEPELPAQAQVVVSDGFIFDFADKADETAVDAVIFLARDELGDPADLVAWEPRRNRMAAWWGDAPLLGMDELYAPRLDPERALLVHETALAWLLGERNGVVICDPSKAASVLRAAAPLKASSDNFGRRLHTLLKLAPPHIYVPSVAQKVA